MAISTINPRFSKFSVTKKKSLPRKVSKINDESVEWDAHGVSNSQTMPRKKWAFRSRKPWGYALAQARIILGALVGNILT